MKRLFIHFYRLNETSIEEALHAKGFGLNSKYDKEEGVWFFQDDDFIRIRNYAGTDSYTDINDKECLVYSEEIIDVDKVNSLKKVIADKQDLLFYYQSDYDVVRLAWESVMREREKYFMPPEIKSVRYYDSIDKVVLLDDEVEELLKKASILMDKIIRNIETVNGVM